MCMHWAIKSFTLHTARARQHKLHIFDKYQIANICKS